MNLFEVIDPGNTSLATALTSATGAPATTSIIFFSPFLSSSLITPTGGPYTVNMTGGNTLDLDGNQSTTVNFVPGLTVAGGVLNINGLTTTGSITVNGGGTLSTSYSSISGLTLNNGGTFQTRDNSFTSGLALTGTGGTVDTFGANPTMSGITGSGNLTVTDTSLGNTGILTLVGASPSYSGITSVNGGTLQLGVNSALPSGGTLNTSLVGTFDLNGFSQTLTTVNNGGTVKTGFGALTVVTTYGGAGTLSVGLQPGLTNLTAGTANLGGPLVVTGHPAVGVYKVVNAGTLNGTFTGITVPFGVTDSITYVPGGLGGLALIDILSDTPFTITGQSSNQASVGAALNATGFIGSADLVGVLNQLSAMTPAQVNAALDQIGPVAFAALSGMSFAGSAVNSAAVNQRLTGLQAGRSNGDGARFASFTAGGQSPYPGTLVAELPGDATAAYSGDKDRLFDPNSPWGVFVSGLGTFDHLDSINGNSGFQPGYSVTATGETVGADYRYNEHFAAGVAGGYVNSFAEIAGGGTIYGQSARLGVYGTAYNDNFHANLYLGGAHDFYDTSRSINTFSRVATASPSGQEFNMDATAGWDLKKEYATVSPFLGLAYDRLMLGSFTENGAGALNLAVNGQTAESLRTTVGAKVSRQFTVPDWFDLTPFASIGWQHELENQSRALTAQLASGGSGAFSVQTADVARDSALLGAGLNLDWTPGFSTRLAYQSTLSLDFHANTFSGSLRWRF